VIENTAPEPPLRKEGLGRHRKRNVELASTGIRTQYIDDQPLYRAAWG
jgi:hypothetical protein